MSLTETAKSKNTFEIQDDYNISTAENPELGLKQKNRIEDHSFPADKPSSEGTNQSNTSDSHELGGSLASFPIQPLQALKYVGHYYLGYFDFGEDHLKSIDGQNACLADADMQFHKTETEHVGTDVDNLVRSNSLPQFVPTGKKKVLSGPILYDNVSSLKKQISDVDR
ncbi:Ribosome biogenesis protein BOP1-like protein [Bienertia sinuspersici]